MENSRPMTVMQRRMAGHLSEMGGAGHPRGASEGLWTWSCEGTYGRQCRALPGPQKGPVEGQPRGVEAGPLQRPQGERAKGASKSQPSWLTK